MFKSTNSCIKKMTILQRVILLAGLLMFIDAARLIVTTGASNNTLLALGITAALLTYGRFFERFKKMVWLTCLIGAAAGFFLALSVFIAWYGNRDNADFMEDAALVLGGGLHGEELSRNLQLRLDKAVEYHHVNPAAFLIVTGGQGPGEDITEALAMERYLIEQGIPASKIIRDDDALSTYENMNYSKIILDSILKSDYTAVIITSDFHMYRSTVFAKQAGIPSNRYHAHTTWYTIPAVYTRECAAVIKLWLFNF